MGISLTASRASVATLCVFGKQFECEHTQDFCAGRRKILANACWGVSPNPVVCGPVLTLRSLTLGQKCPKVEMPGEQQKTVPRCVRCGKHFAKLRVRKSYYHHHQNRCRKPLQTGPFFSPNVNTSALLFKAFLITENASNLPPIRTPRTRRSFRCLLRSGYIFMRNLFHHALIGTVGKVHK